MSDFRWEFDVADGVLKNHSLSAKIREAAIAQTKVLQFVDPEPSYGRGRGDSITITRIKNIVEPTSAVINEGDRIPIDTYGQSSVTITVKDYGRGVEYQHKAELLSHYNLEDRIQRKLRQQLRLVLDTAGAEAFKTAKIKFIPTSLTGGTFDTDGTPSTQATENLTVAHLKVIRDYLMDTIHAPGWRGGDEYVCLASTKACRGLRNDPEWSDWRKRGLDSAAAFYRGQIGTIENINVIEVNHTQALANNKGLSGVLGEFLVFGEDATVMAVAEDPELRAALPGNFGLQKAVAWYGCLNFGLVWDSLLSPHAHWNLN